MALREGSMSLDASNNPSLLTPTCPTCLKELAAGAEIMDGETDMVPREDAFRLTLFFLMLRALLGGAANRHIRTHVQVKCEIILTRATDHRLTCDTPRKDHSFIVVFEQKAVFAALEKGEYSLKKITMVLVYYPSQKNMEEWPVYLVFKARREFECPDCLPRYLVKQSKP